jgi:cellobiose phosphorylase
MKLSEINLQGLGAFSDEIASFDCLKYHLPKPWDYVYNNESVLLRLRHDGCGYAQVTPVAGPAIFRPEKEQIVPQMFTWILPDTKEQSAFTNFWQPSFPINQPGLEPEEYSCKFSPDAARYRLVHNGVLVETEFWVPLTGATVLMTTKITNLSNKTKGMRVMPVLRPHLASFVQGIGVTLQTYQSVTFSLENGLPVFFAETRDSGGIPKNRLRAAIVSDLKPDSFEVTAERFMGRGSWATPEALWQKSLALKPKTSFRYGEKTSPENFITAQFPIAAMMKKITLQKNKSFEFTVAIGMLSCSETGEMPKKAEVITIQKLLPAKVRKSNLEELQQFYQKNLSKRAIQTPDQSLNRYVNEYLELQLKWVNELDRGWPSDRRGTRDAAQDATGIVPVNEKLARFRLIEILDSQRQDGYCMRSYSVYGRFKPPATSGHVDAGLWVWELARDYIYHSRDFNILKEKVYWLNSDKKTEVLDHLIQLFNYYLISDNIGEHGICKIRGGDWNDGINKAGHEGRGESVMVTCQAILGLEEFANLLDYLAIHDAKKALKVTAKRFRLGANKFRSALHKNALNSKGYFNGVFTDAGQWVFSPKDPDGKARVNSTANTFAIIAGVATGALRKKVVAHLDSLKGPHGWRLFYPGIGVPPIEKLGRIGQGDRLPGLSENATPYNHGSNGFLGRAAWVAGKGNWLQDILRYTFPYDQKAHPINISKTAPYGVVNIWREVDGQNGQGGDTFLSGTIATAMRNVYQGVIGFRPNINYLSIDPCVPSSWKNFSAKITFMGGQWEIKVRNPKGVELGVKSLTLDGNSISKRHYNPHLDREEAIIPLESIKMGGNHLVEIIMG